MKRQKILISVNKYTQQCRKLTQRDDHWNFPGKQSFSKGRTQNTTQDLLHPYPNVHTPTIFIIHLSHSKPLIKIMLTFAIS